jgi:hypothetical protein
VYRLVFLLGETDDEKDQTKLEEEAHTYGDIVQVGHTVEDYQHF